MVPVYGVMNTAMDTSVSESGETRNPDDRLPVISFCIVNWNTRDLIDQCLASIERFAGEVRHETIIVDNASSDGSADLVESKYPRVHLIRNDENVGFGRGNNQALRASTGEFCFLINSDTQILSGTPEAFVSFMECHPDAGIATGMVFTELSQTKMLISFVSTFPTPRSVFLSDFVGLTGLKRFFPDSRLVKSCTWTGHNPEREQEVANVTGACMFVRRSAMDEVGLFDESFFMYMEETDWCFRFRQAGWKILYTPVPRIVHLGEGSSRLRNDRDRLYYKSIIHFFEKHYGRASALGYRCQEILFMRWLRLGHRFWLNRRSASRW